MVVVPRTEITPRILEGCLPDFSGAILVGQPGGSKRTFKCTWHGSTVAVQVIEQYQPERLAREVEALRRANSPNLPRLLEVMSLRHLNTDFPVFVCEFIDGETLDELSNRGVRYDRMSLRALAMDIGLGLRALHSNELVHRDIKPQNIIIRRDTATAVIVDLGVAKHLDRTTITRAQPGTPGWAAPEQILNERVDRRADLFCLGLVLHYAASGIHPFGSGDVNENILSGRPNLVIADSHGSEWAQLLSWLLARQPYERPRQIEQVLSCIEGF